MTDTILAVGGHIGDMDLTAGPALAQAVLDGHRVVLVACTPGERGHPRLSPSDYRVQKVSEGRQFAAAIGAELVVLDHSDGFLPADDTAALPLAALIRERTPHTVITHWTRSIHRDHEHAAILTERARFLAAVPQDDPDLPRHAAAEVLHADNWEDAEGFTPDRYVPVSDQAFTLWRDAIGHQVFARGETYGFRYIDYYTAMLTARGCLAGTERACAFRRGGDPTRTVSPL
jgi:LmbE family N-acetylglucosaminyl deacetylase